MVTADTWHMHMNEAGQIEDDFTLRKVSWFVIKPWMFFAAVTNLVFYVGDIFRRAATVVASRNVAVSAALLSVHVDRGRARADSKRSFHRVPKHSKTTVKKLCAKSLWTTEFGAITLYKFEL